MLTIEQKAAWVTALRSGQYTQGRGKLVTEEGAYCCLGVLCKINDLTLKIDGTTLLIPRYSEIDIGGNGSGDYSSTDSLGIPPLKGYHALTSANDSGEVSFEEIADHIEKYLRTSEVV